MYNFFTWSSYLRKSIQWDVSYVQNRVTLDQHKPKINLPATIHAILNTNSINNPFHHSGGQTWRQIHSVSHIHIYCMLVVLETGKCHTPTHKHSHINNYLFFSLQQSLIKVSFTFFWSFTDVKSSESFNCAQSTGVGQYLSLKSHDISFTVLL